ncbi:hypothetical protein ACFYXC_38035 [Streptomyces sp. NPDC002701]|uniref:hypothetical protein n=1 Tax=Streptomyces sp. NPDC002701 TaxID=3364661 RepID=UPI00368D5C27
MPAAAYDYLDLDYTLDLDAAGSPEITPPATWASRICCDDELSVANTSDCAANWVMPTFNVSRAQYGSSADMIDWAQTDLSGRWGLRNSGQPLHRLHNTRDSAANRQPICGATRFTADPAITEDTCDEFPFTGTYEGGALNGVADGRNCAQVTSVRKNTTGGLASDWQTVTPIGTVAETEKCVRGHIRGPLNSDGQ